MFSGLDRGPVLIFTPNRLASSWKKCALCSHVKVSRYSRKEGLILSMTCNL